MKTIINSHPATSLLILTLSIASLIPTNIIAQTIDKPFQKQTYNTEAWTTYGQPQPNDPEITTNYYNGNNNQTARIVILNNPFRDDGILPYTKIETTAKTPQLISIKSTASEYESASFVIQAGNLPLDTVKIIAGDLINEDNKHTITASNIDIRLVKTWFQSSVAMRRTNQDKPKHLVPELLLHDDELIKVDFDKQTNSIRTNPVIMDTDILQPFNIPANLNQQIWITILTPEEITPGNYTGQLTIEASRNSNETFKSSIDIVLTVLPFKLDKSPLLMGQFYLARLVKPKYTYYNARGKSERQMSEELLDMKRHGVNIVTLDHNYEDKNRLEYSKSILSKQIKLIKQANITDNPIVYIDWKVGGQDNDSKYLQKLNTIKHVFNSEGITDFWIYNKDEQNLASLNNTLHTFDAAHKIGSKNIVAVTRPSIAMHLKDYLDLALIQYRSSKSVITELKIAGVTPIAYGLPHAGEEKPATTRDTYGLSLVKKGFAGTLSYAYQAGACWDDWMQWNKSNYRPNVLAYPTIDKPIPTLQWEAWREGVDDIKYLATYAKLINKDIYLTLASLNLPESFTPSDTRAILIDKILNEIRDN